MVMRSIEGMDMAREMTADAPILALTGLEVRRAGDRVEVLKSEIPTYNIYWYLKGATCKKIPA
jgi:hypothetical protein